jgi:predicted RNA-binding Zn-ribbon protein involved in translation (DUF1610 family)
MVTDRDQALGRRALEQKYLTRHQLLECLYVLESTSAPLEQILVERGFLTPDEVRDLAGRPGPAPLFAEILRERGLVTREQVEEALRAKLELESRRVHRFLGEILVERRLITPDHVSQALAVQGKRQLLCEACGYRFNASHSTGYRCPECGREIASRVRDEKPDPCTVRSEIGRGPSGVVYRAFHAGRREDVALKVLPLDWPLLARARRALALEHPNVARLYEVDPRGDAIHVVGEYVESLSLHDHVLGSFRLPVAETVGFMKQIAAGLSAAHEKGIVHGNLKPQNVLITETRELKLSDFCLPRVDGPEFAAYLAPEYGRSGPTPRTDLYACGALWHLMLTGEPRLGAALPSKRFRDIPATADAICARLSAADPAFRYRDAASLMQDLDRLENELPPPEEDAAAPEPARPESARPAPRRRRVSRLHRR